VLADRKEICFRRAFDERENTSAVIGLPASMAVNYTVVWAGTMAASATTSPAVRFGETEVDLGAITLGVDRRLPQ